jgi:mRNA interferase RelE/StbE
MGRAISDRRIRQKLFERASELTQDPEKQGKPLTDELAGFRSIRALGQRYRIIYRVFRDKGIVEVTTLGIRNEGSKQDVYTLAAKLIRQGLIPPGRL